MDHKIKRAEFIYQLNESFSSDDYIKETYDLLKQKRDLKKKNIEYEKLTEDECRTMGSYIMFFIIMNYLVNKGLLKLSMVDKIFANKFFLLCNNKQVQDYQLRSEDINYPVIELYEKWYNYRYLNNMEILYPDNSFSKETEIFNEKNGFISYKNKRKFSLKKLLRKLRLLIKKKK
jgi:hypothetical protein